VPVMAPGISCDAKVCSFANWNIKPGTASDVVIPEDNPKKTIWSSEYPVIAYQNRSNAQLTACVWPVEHFYELNWLSKFWTILHDREGVDCSDLGKSVLDIDNLGGNADKMQSAIGSTQTYSRTMTLLPRRENSLKHRVRSEERRAMYHAGMAANSFPCRCSRRRTLIPSSNPTAPNAVLGPLFVNPEESLREFRSVRDLERELNQVAVVSYDWRAENKSGCAGNSGGFNGHIGHLETTQLELHCCGPLGSGAKESASGSHLSTNTGFPRR